MSARGSARRSSGWTCKWWIEERRQTLLTIKDIARESGYAVGTVSRVLNHNLSLIHI